MADDEWSLPKSINVYMSPHFNEVDQVGLRVYGAIFPASYNADSLQIRPEFPSFRPDSVRILVRKI